MSSSIRVFSLSLIVASLAACGGGGGGSKPKSSSSAMPSSMPASSASSLASSAAPLPASSSASSSIVSEKAGTEVPFTSYTLAELENCGMNISRQSNTFPVFADYEPVENQSLPAIKLTSWNHIANGSTTEWVNLKHPAATYNLGTTAHVNPSCNNVDTLDVVLVKKIADWDRQHANGFERNILDEGYTFGAINKVIIDVKINSARTSVPSVETLKTTYANYVNATKVAELDEGKVNIDVTLHDGFNLNAKAIVQIDQTTYADRWVRITIPMEKFNFYEEINYSRTTKTLAELSNVVIKRMVVVGETKKGTVLRGDINPWSSAVPETFKEMDLSFKKFEFQLN